MAAARLTDVLWNGEQVRDDALAFLDRDRHAMQIAKNVRASGLEDRVDPIDQSRGDRAERLVWMVTALDHETPVHGREIGIDPACHVGSEVQRALDPIVAGLGHALTRTIDAAGGT